MVGKNERKEKKRGKNWRKKPPIFVSELTWSEEKQKGNSK